jgi:predicted Rossmann fold nucleotide-binding protein DprA/Smf involved in DNA uptake
MERNRIVTGLAQVVIVAEANTRGGTWDGAIGALAQQRPLYVCQTEDAPLLPGNQALIERGGRPLYWSTTALTQYAYTTHVLEPVLEESNKLHLKQLTLTHQITHLLQEHGSGYNLT